MDWDIALGDELTREQRKQRFGGALYGGIEPSAQTPNVFIYSDRARGSAFGYNYDGWSEDGHIYLYTGDGTVGDQVESDGGNAAILRHHEEGRALRVFVANGVVAGTRTKRHIYIGEFELVADPPYFPEQAPDRKGDPRTVLVFRLRPVGEVLRRDEDRSDTDEPPSTTEVDVASTPAAVVAVSDVEAHETASYETSGIEPATAVRREAALVMRYRKALEREGHSLTSRRIRPAGEHRHLQTDLFDDTTNELCEAKGVTTRETVRHVLGQLLDYQRHVKADSLAALLPTRPSADLLDLLHSQGVTCVYESDDGFVRLPPPPTSR